MTDTTTTPLAAFKVLTGEEMMALESNGVFEGAPVDLQDGFIHLSTADQLTETVNKHFAGQRDLHVAEVDLGAYSDDAVRWEASRGGELFPHLYAVLLLETVVAYGPLERDQDGQVRQPVTG
jgi:uncharacterized protein (DUF952 family)